MTRTPSFGIFSCTVSPETPGVAGSEEVVNRAALYCVRCAHLWIAREWSGLQRMSKGRYRIECPTCHAVEGVSAEVMMTAND